MFDESGELDELFARRVARGQTEGVQVLDGAGVRWRRLRANRCRSAGRSVGVPAGVEQSAHRVERSTFTYFRHSIVGKNTYKNTITQNSPEQFISNTGTVETNVQYHIQMNVTVVMSDWRGALRELSVEVARVDALRRPVPALVLPKGLEARIRDSLLLIRCIPIRNCSELVKSAVRNTKYI